MDQEDLKRLYNETVIKESKAPYHFDKEVKLETEVLAYNPMCGDKYKLQLDRTGDQIKEAYFHGFGCALSKASTSTLLKSIEGKSEAEVITFCKTFLLAIDQKEQKTVFDQEVLQVLVELNDLGSRSDCIKLSWESLLAYLEEKD